MATPTKYSLKMQNCHISETGGLAKMPGYTRVNSNYVDLNITTGFEYKKNNGATIILAAGNGRVLKLGTNVPVQLSDLATGFDADAKMWFAQFNNICVFSNGIDAPKKYDGTTVSNVGGLPAGTKFCKPHVHKGRLWWTDSANRMMAYHSALLAIDDYTSANNAGYIDFSFVLPVGDELQEILTYVDLLVFIFRNHVAIYSGTNPTEGGDFSIVQIISGVGGVSPDSTLPIGSDLLFIHDSGIKSLKQAVATGNMTVGDVSKDEVTAIQREIRIGLATGKPFAVAHYPQRGWSCFLINEVIWVYSYNWRAWGRLVNANVFGLMNLMDGSMYLLGTGYIYDYGGSWSFDGAAINMSWESAWIAYSQSNYRGYPKIMEIMFGKGVNTDVLVGVSHDMNVDIPGNVQTIPGTSFMDTVQPNPWEESFFMDQAIEFGPMRLPVFGSGKAVQITISNISTEGPIEWTNILMRGVIGGTL
jgi:hypothetical protein